MSWWGEFVETAATGQMLAADSAHRLYLIGKTA